MGELLKNLKLEEKAALVSGTDFMYTNEIPRLSIPAIRMSDGPHGLRVQSEGGDNGVEGSEPATAFPTAVTTASSWNRENTYKMGQAIGEECNDYGVHILLGPGVNMKRNPLCGRNFEYFSEDPFLASEMAIAEVEGVQSQGVGACVKHFALNNAENFCFMGNSVVDERTIREIYLKAFERIAKKAKPSVLMCAYNQINDTFCSENKWLLTDVLRNEWGYDGIVMTDWGAIRDRVQAIKARLDLEMPGDTAVCRKAILDAVADGTLKEEELDACVLPILGLIEKLVVTKKGTKADYEKHHKLAGEIATDCAVLMKNDGVLPLKEENYLVVGDLFEKMRYQGSGSSMINPAFLTTPKNAFDENKVSYAFERGYQENKLAPNEELIKKAVESAKAYETVLVFAGLTDYVESEGGDRETLSLPENQLALINALCETGKKIVVVLYGGSVIKLPFADRVNGILNLFLPGQNGGTATYDLLFGKANPSGKLSETWVKSYDDVPFGREYSKKINELYREGIFIGYRYYETAKKEVAYPFGFGLSYTTFAYADGRIDEQENKIVVTCTVTNTGKVDGAEVVQVYVKAPKGNVFKPEKELRGFEKVFLQAGESKTVSIAFEKDDLRYYHQKEKRWILESGEYEIQICSDCQTIKQSFLLSLIGEAVDSPYTKAVQAVYSTASVDQMTDEIWEEMSERKIPEEPKKKPITMETPFVEFATSAPLGRLMYSILTGVAKSQMKEAEKMEEGAERDNKLKGGQFLLKIFNTNSCRSLSMSAGKSMPYNVAQGFVDFANGKFFKAIKHFCSPVKVPKLPKDQEEK